MRLYWLELKRVLKSCRARILLLIVLALSILMAWLPVAFESINYRDEEGSLIMLNGREAILFKKSLRSVNDGEVTPQKIRAALEHYQNIVSEYGGIAVDSEAFPLEVYTKEISPVRMLLGKLPEAFAHPQTGMGANLMSIGPEEAEAFYEKAQKHLEDVLLLEQKDYPSARAHALEKYKEVETPFRLYGGYSRDAFDYIELFIFVLVLLCTAIAAPTFSNEYQTGSDSILRCTKHGRRRLAVTKAAASLTLFVVTFAVCLSLHLLLSNLAFGPECLKTSMQMLYSVINLPAMNLGQLQMTLVAGGLISLIAAVSFTLFLSARLGDSLSVILIAFIACLLPIFSYSALGVNWISFVLPSSGVGMQNNLLYQLINFNYLHIGTASLWTPYVILAAAAVEIPVFLTLAIRSYCRHETA